MHQVKKSFTASEPGPKLLKSVVWSFQYVFGLWVGHLEMTHLNSSTAIKLSQDSSTGMERRPKNLAPASSIPAPFGSSIWNES